MQRLSGAFPTMCPNGFEVWGKGGKDEGKKCRTLMPEVPNFEGESSEVFNGKCRTFQRRRPRALHEAPAPCKRWAEEYGKTDGILHGRQQESA